MPAHGTKSNMSGTNCKKTPPKIKADSTLSQNRPMGRVVTTSNSLESQNIPMGRVVTSNSLQSHQNGQEGDNSNKQTMCNGYKKDTLKLESKETDNKSKAGDENTAKGSEKCQDLTNGTAPDRQKNSTEDQTALTNGFDDRHVEQDSASSQVRETDHDRNDMVNGEHKEIEMNRESGVNCPAARPKTISWSRTVKHRKEMKEKGKKLVRKRVREKFVYPEIGSSSEDSGEEFITSPKPRATIWSGLNGVQSTQPTLPIQPTQPTLSSTATSASSMECSDYILRFSECYMEDSTDHNSTNTYTERNRISSTSHHANGINSADAGFRYDPNLLQNNLISAPLALPEDSDGSSASNSSERVTSAHTAHFIDNPCDQAAGSITNLPLPSQAENKCRIVAVDHVYVEDHFEVPKVSNFVNIVPPGPSRRSSSESLEEVGDYIETDFPSRACRHMFQSSSHSSSLSTDSDEGYGVNEEPRLPGDLDVEGASYLPSCVSNPNNPSCLHNVLSCDTHPRNLSGSESYNLHVSTSANNSPALSPSSTLGAKTNKENGCRQSHTNRLNSITGRSEEGSDVGGVVGSDSSLIYSPDNDFVEFTDSDVPVSASSATRFFPFSQETEDDVIAPVNYDHVKYGRSPTDYSELSLLNSIQGAEGGATNDLNMYEFDDVENNMELFDPHLLSVDNGNYLYHDICKHEKVPRANFQNSESNRHEKIYFKRTLEKEGHSSESGSSDNEENLAYCLPREQLLNVGEEVERPPQNCESSDCMVLEDLENLTHALQNAVIMQLPSKLEESSGDSSDASEDPIYEDIDFIESLQVKGDNLHVVDEENSMESTAKKVIPKYCRRGQRSIVDVEKVMIWNEYEAYVLQVKQIGTSACGPTAVLNVMKAFDCQVDKEELGKKIITNTRMETAPIPYYLFSRSSAGTTADSLIEGIYKLTRGAIRGRFFHFFPARKVELLKWLGSWIKKGAVPIATLNLQKGVKPGWTIPDAWHHQMVYGVSSKGVYLTNPLEIVSEETIMEQLTSDSVLLVRRQDVVNRFRDWAPLNDLLHQRDPRWLTLNVLGQVVNVLREACTALYQQVPRYRAQMTSHITIPAAYKAGITLFVRQNTEVAHQLFSAPELEIKDIPEAISGQE